ncbi:hypothetical protein [Wolbachia endosymbiont (group E) of Neria commutata]|uniref:hypothetical protein n=1 Tax=Wolbachia endosymbiont (group E) of Neria commutata TaxID=3066149 RepID=UPI0031334DC7
MQDMKNMKIFFLIGDEEEELNFLMEEEEELIEELRAAIRENKNLSSILNNTRYKEHGRDSWLGTMMFYAIAYNREKHTQSILEHIRKQKSQNDFYSELTRKLFELCNQYREHAITVTAFAKKHDILKDLLKDLPDKRIQAKLLEKDSNGEYVHSDGVIVDTLSQKHVQRKLEHVYRSEGFKQLISTVSSGYILMAVALGVFHYFTVDKLSPTYQQEQTTFVLASLLTIFALIVGYVLFTGIPSYVSNSSLQKECDKTVTKLEEQSKNQQSSQPQDTASTKKQEVRENEPESIQSLSDSSVTGIAGPQTDAGITT